MPIKKIIAMAITAMITLSLFGCYSGSSKSSQTSSSEEAGTPSLRERGKMLTDEEVEAERKAMAFDDYYRKWISDEDYMRQWLNSGQQYEEWCIAMDDFIYEIKSFPIQDVPADSKALYDQLLARVMDLRDEGMGR